MRKVGIKEFRDNATKLLALGETMQIERHGHPVGYFIPARKDEAKVKESVACLAQAVEKALEESGMSEDELADLFTLNRDDAFSS